MKHKLTFYLLLQIIIIIIINCDNKFELCNINVCSPEGSYCLADGCQCKSCYISINSEIDHRKCNYHQYSSIKAGILELIFPIGMGHFYLRNVKNGVIKMSAFYFMLCGIYAIVAYCFILIRKCREQDDFITDNFTYQRLIVKTVDEDMKKIKRIVFISQIVFGLLHIVDLYMMFSARYSDDNNILLC